MDHYQVALNFANCVASIFEGAVSRIILYGSVARGEQKPDSDVDIAIIFPDEVHAFPLDLEGKPEFVANIRECAQEQAGPAINCAFYWESEYRKGIELDSGRKTPPDRLDKVGRVLYQESDF